MSTDSSLPEKEASRPTWLARVANYGWNTIIVGAIAMAATYPGRTHGLGMVTEPLLEDLSLASDSGRVFYSSLNFWGTLIGSFFCLPVGWLFDRFDRRVILAGNLLLLGASVIWMSGITNWQQLFVALILTRGLGQSALSVVSITIVAQSFDARRLGLAMAWYAIASVPFHLILIKGAGWALADAEIDWRTVWGCIGIAIMLLSLTATLISKSHHQKPSHKTPDEKAPVGATFGQSLATPAFWVFSLTISVWGMIYAGVALFNQDIFAERGFDQKLYFNVLAMVAIVALASKLLFGYLANSVRLTYLLSACLLATACCLAGLPLATQPWHAYAYGLGLGIASGAVALLFFATWGKLYGQRALGKIQGVAQMLTVFASASGPVVFSYSKQLTTSYTFIFQGMAVVMLIMAATAWFTPLPAFLSSAEETKT